MFENTNPNPVPDPVIETAAIPEPAAEPTEQLPQGWHAAAGRKGAQRIHQLIEQGRLYEKEHGLKRGRQRLRQLIELGKKYEVEHGMRTPQPRKRLSRRQQQEVVNTFVQCLLRMARPAYRAELLRLAEAFQAKPKEERAA